MGKSSKKPRQKMNARKFDDEAKQPKKEKDWGFEEIARSKNPRR